VHGFITPEPEDPCTVEYMAQSMPKDRDEESGKYTTAVTDEELLDHLEAEGGVATKELADAFSYTRPTAYRRLVDLEDAGRVERREVGNSLLWLSARD
jgi:uncharacterized membrane protein